MPKKKPKSKNRVAAGKRLWDEKSPEEKQVIITRLKKFRKKSK